VHRPPRALRRPFAIVAAALALWGAAGPANAQSIPDTFDRVRDAVVLVETRQQELAPQGPGQMLTVDGIGSGVLVDRLGIILTAAHVIQAAEAIEVTFRNGDKYNATVMASEPNADVAALKLEKPIAGATVAKLGDSDQVRVGEEIFIVGAPLGITYSLSVGHIGARRQADQVWGGLSAAEIFQTDAVINRGNSGGPMFNLKGEVIGIVSNMVSGTGGWEGLGFVVTSNVARQLVLEQRTMWTGMEGFLLQGKLAKAFNLPQSHGILVQRVAPDSPASRIGLKAGVVRASIDEREIILGGDIILKVLGMEVKPENQKRIRSMLASLVPGERVTVTVLRGGEVVELQSVMPTS
jgi:S1-C subfamily serine protease